MVEAISIFQANGRYPEYVHPEVRAKYESYMKRIQEIMGKSSFTQEDVEELRDLLRKLDNLQGLEGNMLDDKALVFVFFKAAGIDPYSNDPVDPNKLRALQDISLEIGDKKIKLADALALALDPQRLKESSQVLGDMLLDFANWAYELYGEKVAQLEQQILSATKILNDLQALIEILNQLKIKYPDDFEVDPSKWKSIEDIPQGLREVFAKNNVGGSFHWYQDPPNSGNWVTNNFDAVKKWATDNKGKYIDLCDVYFKQELGVIPNLQPDAIKNLIEARDRLAKQLQNLIDAGNDENEQGSAAHALKKVVDDLNKRFPPDEYPSDKPGEWDMDEAKKRAEEFIMAGQGYKRVVEEDEYGIKREHWEKDKDTPKTIADLINDANTANQFLSSKLSDDLKTLNVFLQTVYDILTQTMKTLDKATQASAQKIAR
jgi:hypothetical protein